ncbi:hypothetical protein FALCPG4_005317 [Fusarium falciforme]
MRAQAGTELASCVHQAQRTPSANSAEQLEARRASEGKEPEPSSKNAKYPAPCHRRPARRGATGQRQGPPGSTGKYPHSASHLIPRLMIVYPMAPSSRAYCQGN